MINFDKIIPHRIWINNQLNKEAEKLKNIVSEYEKKYELKSNELRNRLELAKEELDQEYSNKIEQLSNEFEQKFLEYSQFKSEIIDYINLFFSFKTLKLNDENIRLRIDCEKEKKDFIGEQILLLKTDIDLLQDRLDILSSKSNIADILELLSCSDIDIDIQPDESAKTLYSKISGRINILNNEKDSDKKTSIYRALTSLRTILNERTKYQYICLYIEWLINLKRNYRKNYFSRQTVINHRIKELETEKKDIEVKIKSIFNQKNQKAQIINSYIANPIIDLDANIEYTIHKIIDCNERIQNKHEEKEDCINELNSIQNDINDMKRWGSSDNYKWERLQQERKNKKDERDSLKDEIKSLKNKKKALKNEIEEIKENKSYLSSNCKQFSEWLNTKDIYIPSPRNKKYRNIIESKINELTLIIEEETRKATDQQTIDNDQLIAEKAEKIDPYIETIKDKKSKLSGLNTKLQQLSKNLEDEKAKDNRGLLSRLWSPDTKEASHIKAMISQTESSISQLNSEISSLETEKNSISNKYDVKIRNLRPKYSNEYYQAKDKLERYTLLLNKKPRKENEHED